MSIFDSRYGHIIDASQYGAPTRAHLTALENTDMLAYALMDRLLEMGYGVHELPQPYRDFYLSAVAREETVMGEWKRIKWLLGQKKIDVVPLKGLWLKEKGANRLQYLGDFDLLVDTAAHSNACKLLRESGYEERFRLHSKFHFHSSFFHPEINLWVELHNSLGHEDFHKIPSKEVWERRLAWKEGSLELNPLDQVVYIFYHAALHYFDRPSRILDLHHTWEWAKDKVELKDIVERARSWRCAKMVLLSMIAYSTFVPMPIQRYFTDSEVKSVSNVWEMICLSGKRDRLLRLRLSDSVTDAVRGTVHPLRILGRIFHGMGNS